MIISTAPFIELLEPPKLNEKGQLVALANYEGMLVIVEVKEKKEAEVN